MRTCILLFSFLWCFVTSAVQAQSVRFTVQLADKRQTTYSLTNPGEYLSARAIARRTRQNIDIDSTDLPVCRAYVDSIANIPGVTVISTSKWLNNVLVEAPDTSTINQMHQFHFVRRLTPVGFRMKPASAPRAVKISSNKPMHDAAGRRLGSAANLMLADSLDYGANFPQVHIHEGEYLHNLGYRGAGIVIAVLDGGFYNYQANRAFDSLRANGQILGEYDFVDNEVDVNSDGAHGANCLSIIAANLPGEMIGTAPKASFYLLRSEELAHERPIEEQNWVVAAEYADSAGADMISSSLGYSSFDDTSLSLTYAMRDGRSSPVTMGANMAFRKGMIITCSSGNSGLLTTDYRFVMCPADGDDVLAIGATSTDGQIAPFSSGGPNGAGKLKPNVVSVGANTVFTNPSGVVSTGTGTSYSNPNLAGLIACLWQAFPEFTNRDIFDAVQRSGSRFLNPDERYGYGLPNMRIAYQLLDAKRKQRANLDQKRSFISAYPVPFLQSFTAFLRAPATANASLRILDAGGRLLESKAIQVQENQFYSVTMSPHIVASGTYYLQYDDGRNRSMIRLLRL